MHAIRIDRSKPLSDEPVLEASPGEEASSVDGDAFESQISRGTAAKDLAHLSAGVPRSLVPVRKLADLWFFIFAAHARGRRLCRPGRSTKPAISRLPTRARAIFIAALLVSMLPLLVSTRALAQDYGQATVNPVSLAEKDLAAESSGDVAAALALYGDDAIVQYGGLCWTPCVGKAAIRKELERRVAAKNRFKIIGEYVSGNVAVIQTELQIGYIESSGVGRVVVWNIYEVSGDKIAVATLVGQRTDPQTAQFIKWIQSQPQ